MAARAGRESGTVSPAGAHDSRPASASARVAVARTIVGRPLLLVPLRASAGVEARGRSGRSSGRCRAQGHGDGWGAWGGYPGLVVRGCRVGGRPKVLGRRGTDVRERSGLSLFVDAPLPVRLDPADVEDRAILELQAEAPPHLALSLFRP